MAPSKKIIKKAARVFICAAIILLFFFGVAVAKTSKFYNFEDQLINGEIKKPTSLYLNARKRVQFEQLLKLKRSFMPELYESGRDRIFR
tara:strand:- start:50 stop:316 length:267 start_codon:yes stop_codon:yes gene_type:complete